MKRSALVSWIALSTLLPLSAAGGLPTERQRAIDDFIGQFVDLAMFDGTVLVDIGGEVVYEKSFGLASYEYGIAHDAQTRFRIASVSKTLTDAAVAVLVERGKLDLEAPISRYLPSFPSGQKILVGQLFNHTSGIPHSNGQPWGNAKTSMTLDEIVAELAAVPLDFEPGTDSSYSNGGYAVAAKILEVVGKGSYAEVMRELVFEPFGMKDTAHIEDVRRPIPRIATGYEPGSYPGERRHSRFYTVETRPGGGSLYSTARDLLAFTRGVFRDDFVSEELRRSVLGADDEPFLSQGRSPGFVGKLMFDAERDLIVVSLANSYAVPAGWAAEIADLATGKKASSGWPELRPIGATVAPGDARLGRYRSSRGAEQTIERSSRGAMFIEDQRSESVIALVPLADGAFLMPAYFQRCEQTRETRAITCRMLSGDERYTTEYTPVAD
jgi:CubicO group peptidase (beta-lactamase class C family)